MEALVEMKNIRKEFSGVVALDQVSFDVRPGEVHLLLGENGAGKSTLMKILSGIYTPTQGSILLGNEEFSELTPKKSKELGISIIYQELSVVNDLSIAENLFVGKLPVKKWFSVLPVVDKRAYHQCRSAVHLGKAARGDCKGFGGKFEITCYGRADFVLNRGGNKKSF